MTDRWNIPSAIIDSKYRSQKMSKCSVHKKIAIILSTNIRGSGGHAVAQLVEALRYKSVGRGFDS